MPFISDAIYRNLRTVLCPNPCIYADFPDYHPEMRDEPLEAAMAAVQTTVSMGHALRKEHKLKVRQPLPAAHIASARSANVAFSARSAASDRDELNVKDILFSDDEQRSLA